MPGWVQSAVTPPPDVLVPGFSGRGQRMRSCNNSDSAARLSGQAETCSIWRPRISVKITPMVPSAPGTSRPGS